MKIDRILNGGCVFLGICPDIKKMKSPSSQTEARELGIQYENYAYPAVMNPAQCIKI